MMKRHGVYALLLLSLIGSSAYSQENQLVTGTIVQRPAQQVVSDDTIPAINLGEEELDNIVDIRKQFEKQNKTYSAPLAPSTNLLRFLKKDELEISDEAMYWARLVRDASTAFDNTMTFRDTVIVNPLFMPIVFRGDYLPKNLIFYNFDSLKERTPYDNLYRTDSIFKDLERNKQFEEMAYKYVQNNYPTYFRYSERDLPNEVIKPKFIKKNIYEDLPIKVEADANFEDVDAPARFIPERRYWISAFESAVQFSQNYVSENWYKGGSSNLNLFTKNNLKYDYKKDKVQVTNELEFKASVYTAPKGLDPENQLCTDDFAGHFAHNTNLSIKAILGVASYGRLAEMLGKKDVAEAYTTKARQMATEWERMANDGDHYRLTFDKPGTWSQKYNLVWDRLLGLDIFDSKIAEMEIPYYLAKQNIYGLPLDNRETYTKTDWIMWTATMAPDQATFREFIVPVHKFMNETIDRVPMSDWVFTDKPNWRGFKARSVIGGYYMKMLEGKLMQNKQ